MEEKFLTNETKRGYTTTRDCVYGLIPLFAQGVTLDIGAGNAKYRGFISKHVAKYLTTDIAAAEGVDFVEDACAMTLESNQFDTVLSFQMLEHVDNPQAATGEMYRVLKPGGRVIATAPFLIQEHGHPSDFQRFTTHGFRVLFERAGFEVIELGTYGSTATVCAEMLKFAFLSPYKEKRNTLLRKGASILARFCMWMDKKGWMRDADIYANVYVVALKR